MLFAWIINTAIVNINAIKSIRITIISHFIQAIILQLMFVNKGKINTSRFFIPMLHQEKSPGKPQYNMATLFLGNLPPFFLTPIPPPYSTKHFQTSQFLSNFEKVKPPCPLWGGGGGGGWTVFKLCLNKLTSKEK